MMDIANEHCEHMQHAGHGAEEDTSFTIVVSMTIAVLAVIAASIGSLESIETTATLTAQNSAALNQNKASDLWAFFQAKSLKKNAYNIAAMQDRSLTNEFLGHAKQDEEDSRAIKARAEELDRIVEESLQEAGRHEKRHQILTIAVTMLHAGIAVSTIAIITKRRRWAWFSALALAAGGIMMTGYTYM